MLKGLAHQPKPCWETLSLIFRVLVDVKVNQEGFEVNGANLFSLVMSLPCADSSTHLGLCCPKEALWTFAYPRNLVSRL